MNGAIPTPEPAVTWLDSQLPLAVQKLHLAPDDMVVISCPTRLNVDQVAHLLDAVRRLLPGRRVLVLENGMRLGVVSTQPADRLDAAS